MDETVIMEADIVGAEPTDAEIVETEGSGTPIIDAEQKEEKPLSSRASAYVGGVGISKKRFEEFIAWAEGFNLDAKVVGRAVVPVYNAYCEEMVAKGRNPLGMGMFCALLAEQMAIVVESQKSAGKTGVFFFAYR